ncbi:MAG: hypothetical protein AVDCRST_MAG83-2419 [uncultured Arthrobacter sp.]|uniref:Uncharacterized protein n=1 Tax=uncultured Arthrobacter sp. TaxID=114050 RepID=A0A6J4IPT2_9MICC|nr:hypothetical protein [uncultured Arthrobacter sp.]CAA9256128.1 MAG: hypothetical protein AVDCRST_MAG83-2419 [uncultured Arthrobacter sp.]
MSESSPSPLKQIMIAAADLEQAEFERDRLALLYRDLVLAAFAAGEEPGTLSEATGIPEAELLRIAALVTPAERSREASPR